MANLENIWKEYDQFENDLNKILAKALINEFAPKYMQSRSIFRERKRFYDGILRFMLPTPPDLLFTQSDVNSNFILTGSLSSTRLSHENSEASAVQVTTSHQILLWKRLINYEKTNPQKLDAIALHTRVTFTYNQCLLCLYYFPEIWFDFAKYEIETGHVDNSITVFERALTALPDCFLIYFIYADTLESLKNIKAAKEVYEKLVNYVQSENYLNDNSNQQVLIYIQYMKFARRTEGIKAAREVFKVGRKSKYVDYHLYAAAALMEWQQNKDIQVARSIFDLGMNKYSNIPQFLMEYINFLIHLNEENNIRVLFERAVAQLPKDKSKEIWYLYQAFEYSNGDLSAFSKVEARRIKLFPEDDPSSSGILTMVNRYRYLDLWPCNTSELDSFSSGNAAAVNVVSENSATDKDGNDISINFIAKKNPKLNKYPRPDLTLLIPVNPNTLVASPSTNAPLEGAAAIFKQFGILPESIAHFLLALPSPQAYQGPFADVDQLLKLITETPLPPPPVDKKRKEFGDEEDEEGKEFYVYFLMN